MSIQYSSEYDEIAKKAEWYGPDVLFGLAYQYISEGQTLLDIGIGTGLSSLPFYLAGLDITGIDSSPDMLLISEQKKFATELIFHDIKEKLPVKNQSYNHVVCCGVLHFFDKLDDYFKEAYRIIKPNGIYAITVIEDNVSFKQDAVLIEGNGSEPMFRHNPHYIETLLKQEGFEKLKSCSFQAFSEESEKIFYRCYILKKK